MDSIVLHDTSRGLAELSLSRAMDRAGHAVTANPKDLRSLKEAAQEFEGYFIGQLMKAMRETVPTGLFENKAGQMFYTFYDQEIGRLAAQAGGLGLAAMIEAHYAHKQAESGDKITLKSGPIFADITTDGAESAGGQGRSLQVLPSGGNKELSDAHFRQRPGK
ncbi:MAG: rod-binding protein [Nitrospirota bacterium]